jgi:chemotaxis protein methyltransferase CheR
MNSNLSQSDYCRFRELVRQKSGLQLANYRLPDLVRVIEELADKTGLSEPNSLYELLCQSNSSGRAALDQFIGALTVGESYFFRNRPHFDALEKKILPQLIESRQHVKRLRIWCAGCSTGEEPYSIAILLKRLLPDIARWKILILATDINRTALQKARTGLYRAWSLRQVPSQIESLYFTTQDTFNHQIRSDIRQMVTFSYLNLAKDIYPSILNNTYKLDLILCRNVLIYFDQSMFKQVVGRLYNTLLDDGWLVVGHAEPSPEIFRQFKAHCFPRTIVYQKVGAGLAPAPLAAIRQARAGAR